MAANVRLLLFSCIFPLPGSESPVPVPYRYGVELIESPSRPLVPDDPEVPLVPKFVPS